MVKVWPNEAAASCDLFFFAVEGILAPPYAAALAAEVNAGLGGELLRAVACKPKPKASQYL